MGDERLMPGADFCGLLRLQSAISFIFYIGQEGYFTEKIGFWVGIDWEKGRAGLDL